MLSSSKYTVTQPGIPRIGDIGTSPQERAFIHTSSSDWNCISALSATAMPHTSVVIVTGRQVKGCGSGTDGDGESVRVVGVIVKGWMDGNRVLTGERGTWEGGIGSLFQIRQLISHGIFEAFKPSNSCFPTFPFLMPN